MKLPTGIFKNCAKHFLYVSIFLFFSTNSFSQTTFQRIFIGWNHNYGNFVQQTSDKGFVVAGYTNSFGAGNNDVYLFKCDTTGILQWSKTFGGTGDDRAWSVQQTIDGGFIIAGQSTSFSFGGDDFYLLKTDNMGSILWTKTYGGSGNYNHAYAVRQTVDKGYIIAGSVNGFGTGNIDTYLVKTDSLGAIIWAKTYGGIWDDWCYSVQQTSDGGYVTIGQTSSFGAIGDNIYMIKTDSIGTVLWSKVFGGVGFDTGRSVVQTNDGGYIIVGSTGSYGAGNYDVYLIKTDTSGTPLWTKTFGGTGGDNGNSVQETKDGGYIICGLTGSFGAGGSDVYLLKTDSAGALIWSKTFGGSFSDYGNSVQQTADGGYIITGYTGSFGSGYAYLIKTDSVGNSGCYETNPSCQSDTGGTSLSPATIMGTGGISFTPPTLTNGGGPGYDACTFVGFSEREQMVNSCIILPNPVSLQATLKTSYSLENATLEFYNLQGQKMKQINNISGNMFSFYRDGLISGLYFVHLIQDDRILTIERLIVID